MSRASPAGILRCGKKIVSDESSYCLFAIRFTRRPYVWRFPLEEFQPEFLNLTVKHLLKITIWCCMVDTEVGHCRWKWQCNQMQEYTVEMHGAISISGITVSVLFEGRQGTFVIVPNQIESDQHQDAD